MRLLPLISAMAIFATLPHQPAQASRMPQKPADLCGAQVAFQERSKGIPHKLLTAISHVESGRWSKARGEMIAWPWTVTSGADGRYFPTKLAAINHVKALQKQGIKNIDVGCMQINLRAHAKAFKSLDDALDPKHNVAYAASFLKSLFDETGSWAKASTHYHSRTPSLARKYKAKLDRLWRKAKEAQTEVAAATPDASVFKPAAAPMQVASLPAAPGAIGNPGASLFRSMQVASPEAEAAANSGSRTAAPGAILGPTTAQVTPPVPGLHVGKRTAPLNGSIRSVEESGDTAGFEKRRRDQLARWRAGLPLQ
ncbi:MAG: transglycosylase SLT domain-containing protein [Magnetospiraceae bacterium]